MWFQRLVEIDDDSEPEPILRSTERPGAARSGERTKKRKVPVSTPADFQRVRLMTILRLKEQKANDARDKAYTNPEYSISLVIWAPRSMNTSWFLSSQTVTLLASLPRS